MARCQICSKSAVSGSQVSHSQIHSKRTFAPNLQKVNGLVLCTRCLKSIKKVKRIEDENRQAQIEKSQKKPENIEPKQEEKALVKKSKSKSAKK